MKAALVLRVRRNLLRSLALSGALLTGASAAGAMALGGDEAERPAPRATAPAVTTVRVPFSALAVPPETAPLPAVPATAKRTTAKQRPGRDYYRRTTARKVPAATQTSFLPLYREAERAFGVSWRLVASIHRQETAFSTVPSTYVGLNAFGCCAGPMQFNVKNGPVSTWKAYRDAFKQAERPRSYPHRTSFHPSIYDDFDAIMAAGALLRDNGATKALDGPSWLAAYLYYGRDLFGITYANQVVARARVWARDGFQANSAADKGLEAALDDAFGVGERKLLLAGDAAAAEAKKEKAKQAKAKRAKAKKAAAAERAKAERTQEDAPAKRKRTGKAQKPAAKPTKPAAAPPSPTTTSTATGTRPPPATTPSEPPASSTPPEPPPSGSTCANVAGVGCG